MAEIYELLQIEEGSVNEGNPKKNGKLESTNACRDTCILVQKVHITRKASSKPKKMYTVLTYFFNFRYSLNYFVRKLTH